MKTITKLLERESHDVTPLANIYYRGFDTVCKRNYDVIPLHIDKAI